MFTVDLAPEAKRKRASRKCRGQKKKEQLVGKIELQSLITQHFFTVLYFAVIK